MDSDIQRVLDELKTVASSVADLKSSLTKRMDGMEKSLGDRFTALKSAAKQIDVKKPKTDPDVPACFVATPKSCIAVTYPDAPAWITPAPIVSAAVFPVDAGERLAQCGTDDLTPVDFGPEFAPHTSFQIPRGGALHCFEYGVPTATFLATLRGGGGGVPAPSHVWTPPV
ncbi:unnamed protein product [Urochloa humidicola]